MLTTSACVPGSEMKVHADQNDSEMEMSSPSACPALQNKTPTQDCTTGRRVGLLYTLCRDFTPGHCVVRSRAVGKHTSNPG